jgi:hypothetical protein
MPSLAMPPLRLPVLALLLAGCGGPGASRSAELDAYRLVAADLAARVPDQRAARLSPYAFAPGSPPLDSAVIRASGLPVYDDADSLAVALLSLSPASHDGGEVEMVGAISLAYPETDERGGHTFRWTYRLDCDRSACRIADVRERSHDSWIMAPDSAPAARR